jgi:hypothetical protein
LLQFACAIWLSGEVVNTFLSQDRAKLTIWIPGTRHSLQSPTLFTHVVHEESLCFDRSAAVHKGRMLLSAQASPAANVVGLVRLGHNVVGIDDDPERAVWIEASRREVERGEIRRSTRRDGRRRNVERASW